MVAGSSRFQGYVAGLTAADRPLDERLVVRGDFGQESGAAAMRTLLDREPDIDGVFCANDLMALGALQTLRDAGRKVPAGRRGGRLRGRAGRRSPRIRR